jgi:hypothetical protein
MTQIQRHIGSSTNQPRLVEVSSNVVFDETSGSPREQVDLDDVDEDEVPSSDGRNANYGDR